MTNKYARLGSLTQEQWLGHLQGELSALNENQRKEYTSHRPLFIKSKSKVPTQITGPILSEDGTVFRDFGGPEYVHFLQVANSHQNAFNDELSNLNHPGCNLMAAAEFRAYISGTLEVWVNRLKEIYNVMEELQGQEEELHHKMQQIAVGEHPRFDINGVEQGFYHQPEHHIHFLGSKDESIASIQHLLRTEIHPEKIKLEGYFQAGFEQAPYLFRWLPNNSKRNLTGKNLTKTLSASAR